MAPRLSGRKIREIRGHTANHEGRKGQEPALTKSKTAVGETRRAYQRVMSSVSVCWQFQADCRPGHAYIQRKQGKTPAPVRTRQHPFYGHPCTRQWIDFGGERLLESTGLVEPGVGVWHAGRIRPDRADSILGSGTLMRRDPPNITACISGTCSYPRDGGDNIVRSAPGWSRLRGAR